MGLDRIQIMKEVQISKKNQLGRWEDLALTSTYVLCSDLLLLLQSQISE